MKVVFTDTDNYFIGLHTSCLLLQIETVIWHPKYKPVYDMIVEQKPDILFLKSCHVSPVIEAALNEYKNIKTVILGQPITFPLTPNLWCIPCDAKYTPEDISSNCTKMILNKAANIGEIRNGRFTNKYSSDIVHFTHDNMEYINQLYSVIYPTRYKFRCYGSQYVKIPNYIGSISTENIAHVLASNKITIDYNKNHMYDAAINKCLTLSNVENSIGPSFKTNEELSDNIYRFMTNEKERRKVIKAAYNETINNHTYLHRLGQILQYLEINIEEQINNIIKKIRK